MDNDADGAFSYDIPKDIGPVLCISTMKDNDPTYDHKFANSDNDEEEHNRFSYGVNQKISNLT
jgi:hypothetical protein